MGIFELFFGRRPATAGIAKERLQIVLAHERASRDTPDFLPALQRELLEVIGRYVEIKDDLVKVKIGRQSGDTSVLEINVEMDPSTAKKPADRPTPVTPTPANKTSPPRSKSVGKRR
ncbi:MAG: cell division topological specificity factor MinE [Rhodospirillales bacterium]|nr:cell division topological specificity factor MinE [Rhodospirillales bacterium]